MRIFLAIPGSPNPTFVSSLWRVNLHDPLVAMGHDVVLFEEGVQPLFDLDPDAPSTAAPRTAFGARLLQAIDEAQAERALDLVITYLSDSHVDPQVVDHIAGRNAPVLNFFCNNVHQFHLVRRTVSHYTACLVPEKTALADYRAVSARPIFFPMAANPRIYRPLDLPHLYDVSFAGQRYADRASAMLALRDNGIDAHAFGQGWAEDGAPAPGAAAGSPFARAARSARGVLVAGSRLVAQTARGRDPGRAVRDWSDWSRLRTEFAHALHESVSDEAYVSLFSSSRISLGFLVLGDTHRTRQPLRQVRLREFEGPMAGAFYVTEWIEEIAEHYEPDREIICVRSHEELVDRCRYYLCHETERERIRQAGHARARRDHTWQRRFETLFDTLAKEGVLPAST